MNDKTESIYIVKVMLDFMDEKGEHFPKVQAINQILHESSFSAIQSLEIDQVPFQDIKAKLYRKN